VREGHRAAGAAHVEERGSGREGGEWSRVWVGFIYCLRLILAVGS
jgi:hypothetical protein